MSPDEAIKAKICLQRGFSFSLYSKVEANRFPRIRTHTRAHFGVCVVINIHFSSLQTFSFSLNALSPLPLHDELIPFSFKLLILSFSLEMAEKARAYTTTYYRFTTLAKLSFRFAELCVALALLAWISARIPLVVEISGDYFRQVSAVFSNPLFVFFLCHVILVSLMANSGQFSGRDQRSASELYDGMVKNCEGQTTESGAKNDVSSCETEEIVYQDKQVISEVNSIAVCGEDTPETLAESDPDSDFQRVLYQRWRPENFERETSDHHSENLQRSGSEKCIDIVVSGEREQNTIAGDSHRRDEMSDEDFNRIVEAFIAKQLKFRRQEDVHDAVSLSCGDKSYELTKAKR